MPLKKLCSHFFHFFAGGFSLFTMVTSKGKKKFIILDKFIKFFSIPIYKNDKLLSQV